MVRDAPRRALLTMRRRVLTLRRAEGPSRRVRPPWTANRTRNSLMSGEFMIYALICTDKPDSLAIRKANRPQHLAYLESLGETLVLAGPFTEPDGETMNGSLVVVEASSLEAARKIAAGDPFAKAGLFAHVEIRPWLWTINNPDEEE